MPVPFQARTERDLKRPGYCALSHMQKFVSLVALGRLHQGEEITPRRLGVEFGFPKSEKYLVLAGARHLGFVDEENRITETFVQLVRAKGEEYREKFTKVLEDSYPGVFNAGLDLSHATQQEFKQAFHALNYEPFDMQVKMIGLFKGLARMAGIIPDESNGSQAGNGHVADTLSSTSPLNTVPLTLTELKSMPESSLSSKMNGTLPIRTDYTVVEEILTSIEELHQELSQSIDWTETDQEKWEKFLKINHTMLGNALKLLKRARQ